MPASKAQRALTAERRSKAITMRVAGVDWETIASHLGYASRGAACTDVDRALAARVAEQTRNVDVLREAELLRLDRLQAGVWAQAVAGDTKAVDAALKIIDRRCKLLGLDPPQRHEVVTLDAVEAEIRRLSAELEFVGPVEAGPAAGTAPTAPHPG